MMRIAFALLLLYPLGLGAAEPTNARPPAGPDDLRFWLENMVWFHDYSLDEIEASTGLPAAAIQRAQARWNISPATKPDLSQREKLLVLPYPGGRHPRIGFLEGAVDPQRETKFSVFLPWEPSQYVVVDVPEAIWSNLGLTYLAHTHVPTIWERQGVRLAPQEWERIPGGDLKLERTLPNGIRFGTLVESRADHVKMKMWLHNGTEERLTDLRVQNCTMLRAADEFNALTAENKLARKPFVAVRNAEGNRWIITAWEPCDRPWNNPRCPCLHSDPKFPDCAPGETQTLSGWFSFYEGTDIQAEFDRIERVWKSQ